MRPPRVRVIDKLPERGTVSDLRVGDRYDECDVLNRARLVSAIGQSERDPALVAVTARIVSGEDTGATGTWVYQPDQPVEYLRKVQP